jgi:hypothetical protein
MLRRGSVESKILKIDQQNKLSQLIGFEACEAEASSRMN